MRGKNTQPPFNKTALPGGLIVLVERIPYLHTVSFGLWLNYGSRHETPGTEGAAHFIEHMLFKGTAKRTTQDIAREIESVGASLNAMTGREITCCTGRTLPEYLPAALDILFDICFDSGFPADEYDRERQVIMEEIKEVFDTPDDLVYDIHHEFCFGDSPIAHPILGSEETVGDMPRDMLIDLYRREYTPAAAVVALAGNIRETDAAELIGRLASKAAAAPRNHRAAAAPPAFRKGIHLVNRPIERANFVLSVEGVPYDHEDRYIFGVLDMLLSGGMSSRLFQEVRDKRGLAYDIATENAHYKECGLFSVSAGARPANLVEIFKVIAAELGKIKSGDVRPDELDRVKNLLRTSIAMSLESASSRMMKIARSEIYYGRNLSDDEIMEKVRSIDLDSIVRVARNIFTPGGFAVSVLAPLENGLADVEPLLLEALDAV